MHLEIVQGTQFQVLASVKMKDETDTLVPYPLTDCFIQLQARFKPSEPRTLLDISSDSEEIMIDGEAGTFLISLTSARTSALVWGQPHIVARALFQCEITPPDGEPFRAMEGTITLNPEVVR